MALATPSSSMARPGIALASLTALGVVFGDIGTSPLYTLKTVIALGGGRVEPSIILGILSLIF
jgi:KUP system potassium uptake protein